ncbi:Hypothetical protein POVN_LOCUS495, partial [uncultured virus]
VAVGAIELPVVAAPVVEVQQLLPVAAPASAPKVGAITLPRISTLIPPIPLTEPTATIEQSALISAFAPEQQAITVIKDIDPERVTASRSKPSGKQTGKNPYSLIELRAYARQLGIKTSQTKAILADEIMNMIQGAT